MQIYVKPGKVVLPPKLGATIFSHICSDTTIELGGVLLGQFEENGALVETVIPINNVGEGWDYIPDPDDWFRHVKTTSLLKEKSNVDYLGFYHSHPNGKAIPSQIDCSRASYRGVWLIISPQEMDIRPWWWDTQGFEEIQLNQRPKLYNFRVELINKISERSWNKCKLPLLAQEV